MKKDGWKKEVARDFLAIGSIPFFILVIARVILLNDPDFLSQFIIAGVIFLLLTYFFKTNVYSGLALITVVLLSLFYNDQIRRS